MDLMRIFKQVPSLAAEDVRKFLGEKTPEEYNLIDVRQPGEYEQGHLPGAQLVPLGELSARFREIDPAKPTIVY